MPTEIKEMLDNFKSEVITQINEKNDKFVEDVDAKIKDAIKNESRIVVGAEGLEKDTKGGFKSLSHFAKDIAGAAKTGYRKVSKELSAYEEFCQKAAGSPSQNITDGEAGGYLVPEEFRMQLLKVAEEKNELMSRCMQIPMQYSSVRIPYINGFDKSGGLVYGNVEWLWTDEEETRTAKSVKTGYVGLTLHKLAGLAYVSDEMLSDSPMSMENILQMAFADGYNFQMNKVLLKGTGAGQPLGVHNAPCTVSVAKETGQPAATIKYENIVKMYSRLLDRTNAVWVINPDCFPQIATMSLAVGTGGVSVYLPASGAADRPFDSLMGLPIIWSHHAKTVGTVGDINLLDMSQYLLGMKAGGEGIKFDSSVDFKFDVDQTAFKFTFRVAGQPWMPSALTPQESSNTLSPFVTLASRA